MDKKIKKLLRRKIPFLTTGDIQKYYLQDRDFFYHFKLKLKYISQLHTALMINQKLSHK